MSMSPENIVVPIKRSFCLWGTGKHMADMSEHLVERVISYVAMCQWIAWSQLPFRSGRRP